jgi:hypothetical protein
MSDERVEESVNKWAYLIWNAHSESVTDFAGVREKVRAALQEARREALKEAAEFIFESNEYNHDVHSRHEQATELWRLAGEEQK